MSYGHSPLFFKNAEEAQAYLDGCAKSSNYTAENYQDRVRAQRCIRHAAGWSPPPIKDFPRDNAPRVAPPARRRKTA